MNLDSQYEYKYLKYKTKYLELKKIYDELNGGNPEVTCVTPIPNPSLHIKDDNVYFTFTLKDKPYKDLWYNKLRFIVCSNSKLLEAPDNTLVNESNIKITKIITPGAGAYGLDQTSYEIIFPKEFKIKTELGKEKYTGKEIEVCSRKSCNMEEETIYVWEYRKGKDDTWKKTDINNKKFTFIQNVHKVFYSCKMNDV